LLSREERLISAAYRNWAQSKGVREDAGENVMPMLQAVLGRLNRRFSGQELLETRSRREMWAPGKSLGQIARESRTAPPELLNGWATFLDTMPVAIQETIRAVAYAALSADPPVEVTFAWAPGYDFEVNVWQSRIPRARGAASRCCYAAAILMTVIRFGKAAAT
jgi:hypothetical protein